MAKNQKKLNYCELSTAESNVSRGIEDDVFEGNQPGPYSESHALANLNLKPDPETDEKEEGAFHLIIEEYLISEQDKSSSNQGDENFPVTINR